MGLLDWFRQSTPKFDEERVSEEQVENTIDYVVKMTDARLPLVHHYRLRLEGPVTRTLEYLHSLKANMLPVHDAGPLSWSLDPSMRAFFSQAGDLAATFGQCQSLHNYAATASVLDPIYAVLAMHLSEQQRFGTELQGELLVRDVAQTSLSFSHHRLRLFARSEREMWHAIARRLLDELAMIALERMQAEHDQRRELEEDRGLLTARLATFRQRGAGTESFLGEEGMLVSCEESAALLDKLSANETQLAALGCPSEMLDRQLDYLAEVLAEPMRLIRVEHRRVTLDSMNLVVEPGQGEEIEFGVIHVERDPPKQRVFLPVRVDRALIGDGRRLQLDNAERWL